MTSLDSLNATTPLHVVARSYTRALTHGEEIPEIFYSMAFHLPKDEEWKRARTFILRTLKDNEKLVEELKRKHQDEVSPFAWTSFLEHSRQWHPFLTDRGGATHYEATVWKFHSYESPLGWLLVRRGSETPICREVKLHHP